MIYKLSRKTFGTKQILDLIEINTEDPINDICFVEDLGLVFSTSCFLGLITPELDSIFPWKGEGMEKQNGTKPSFGWLSGMSYDAHNKRLLVAEDGGRDVRCIDFQDGYTKSLIQKQTSVSMEKILSKTPRESYAFVSNLSKSKFYLLIPELSKCFLVHQSDIMHVAGDGKYRYSTGTNTISSSIGMPSGMAIQKDKLYIADSLRNVIRTVNQDTISLCYGHPHKKILNKPSKIVIEKNIMYIVCADSIWTYIIDKNLGGSKPIYESNAISNIANDSSGGLYILEEQNA